MGLQCYVLLVLLSMFIHGNTNIIDCLDTQACRGQTLNCNANEPCIINCDSQGGQEACKETNIYQNDATTMTVNCLDHEDCDNINIYCGAGGCTHNCARVVDSCRWTHLHCGAGHCASYNITEQFASLHCTNDCPSSLTPTSNPAHNPTLNPTSQPTSSKAPTKNSTPILSTSNPTTSQPTVSPTTHMSSTSARTTDISTTDISTSYMRIPTVLTTTIQTSFMYTTDMPTATPIKQGNVNEIYTTDMSNEYTLNKNELTTNDKKQSNILIYIILTIGSILCFCFVCIFVYNKNKNINIITENIQASTPTENDHGTFGLNLTNVVGVNDVLMNGMVNEINGVMIVTSGGPIENNETNDGTFPKNSAPNNPDDDYEILSDDEIFNGVNTLHGENDYTVNEKVTEGNSDGEQYMDPVLNSQT